ADRDPQRADESAERAVLRGLRGEGGRRRGHAQGGHQARVQGALGEVRRRGAGARGPRAGSGSAALRPGAAESAVGGNTPVGSPSPAALRAAMTPLPPPVGTPGPPRPQPAPAPPVPAPPKA